MHKNLLCSSLLKTETNLEFWAAPSLQPVSVINQRQPCRLRPDMLSCVMYRSCKDVIFCNISPNERLCYALQYRIKVAPGMSGRRGGRARRGRRGRCPPVPGGGAGPAGRARARGLRGSKRGQLEGILLRSVAVIILQWDGSGCEGKEGEKERPTHLRSWPRVGVRVERSGTDGRV